MENKLRRDLVNARKETNTNPTKRQIESGNYKKGIFNYNGLKIRIENPKGSVREGVNDSGKKWSIKMKDDYGYISNGGKDKDGEGVDVFIGPDLNSKLVYIVDQYINNRFDEHKVILGAKSKDDAKKIYYRNYEKGWKGLRNINELTFDQFKKWLKQKKNKTKPAKDDVIKIGMEKISLNALKMRQLAKQVGIIADPSSNWKWALRQLRKPNPKGIRNAPLMLSGKELAKAKEKLGRLPNNMRQKFLSAIRREGKGRELALHSTGEIVLGRDSAVDGIKDIYRPYKYYVRAHTHPMTARIETMEYLREHRKAMKKELDILSGLKKDKMQIIKEMIDPTKKKEKLDEINEMINNKIENIMELKRITSLYYPRLKNPITISIPSGTGPIEIAEREGNLAMVNENIKIPKRLKKKFKDLLNKRKIAITNDDKDTVKKIDNLYNKILDGLVEKHTNIDDILDSNDLHTHIYEIIVNRMMGHKGPYMHNIFSPGVERSFVLRGKLPQQIRSVLFEVKNDPTFMGKYWNLEKPTKRQINVNRAKIFNRIGG